MSEPASTTDIQNAGIARKILRLRAAFKTSLPHNITHDPAPDILLLLFLADVHHRHLSQSELADSTGLRESAISRWVAVLVAEGLVRRDGYLVSLTRAGRERILTAVAAAALELV